MKPVIFFFIPNNTPTVEVEYQAKIINQKFDGIFIPIVLTARVDEIKVRIYDGGIIHEIN